MSGTPWWYDGPPVSKLQLVPDDTELLCHRGTWAKDWYSGECSGDIGNAQYILVCGTCGKSYRTLRSGHE